MERNKRIIAITGPSGAGKTTLGNNLHNIYGYELPSQATTRNRRSDDMPNSYEYLAHEEFAKHAQNGDFLFYSGDGPEIKKEYGNFYGYLRSSCEKAWENSNTIVLYVSYKDIDSLREIGTNGIELDLINLTFKAEHFASSVESRIRGDKSRNHTEEDIARRVKCATEYEDRYGKAVQTFASAVICTDIRDEVSTLEETMKALNKKGGEIGE